MPCSSRWLPPSAMLYRQYSTVQLVQICTSRFRSLPEQATDIGLATLLLLAEGCWPCFGLVSRLAMAEHVFQLYVIVLTNRYCADHVQMLTAIWPSFATLPNHLPTSAGLTTAGMISYFLYWLIQFPLLLIPTHKLQYLFWIKTVLTPPVAIGMVTQLTMMLFFLSANYIL